MNWSTSDARIPIIPAVAYVHTTRLRGAGSGRPRSITKPTTEK